MGMLGPLLNRKSDLSIKNGKFKQEALNRIEQGMKATIILNSLL
jgi:hypothetical protein